MTEFKKGDKVKVLRSRNFFGDEGYGHDIGSVKTLKEINKSLSKGDFDGWDVEEGGWVRSDDIELVEEEKPLPTPEYSCIRVVPPSKPKREIVESKAVFDCHASFLIRNGYDGDVCIDVEGRYFTPKALREAAALFTTLAEVLEENSNA